jgi:hypothetical protein
MTPEDYDMHAIQLDRTQPRQDAFFVGIVVALFAVASVLAWVF